MIITDLIITDLTQAPAPIFPEIRNKIIEVEAYHATLPQVSIPVEEAFFDGMYIRKICIPPDTILTGAIHKRPYLDIMVSGDISVISDNNEGCIRLQGFNIMEGKAWRKRIGLTHLETIWITIHRIGGEL